MYRITELQQSHVSELARLQHTHSSELATTQRALQEERDKRETAEKSLEAQSERDVSITMEDVQPFAAMTVGGAAPTTFGAYIYIYISYVW